MVVYQTPAESVRITAANASSQRIPVRRRSNNDCSGSASLPSHSTDDLGLQLAMAVPGYLPDGGRAVAWRGESEHDLVSQLPHHVEAWPGRTTWSFKQRHPGCVVPRRHEAAEPSVPPIDPKVAATGLADDVNGSVLARPSHIRREPSRATDRRRRRVAGHVHDPAIDRALTIELPRLTRRVTPCNQDDESDQKHTPHISRTTQTATKFHEPPRVKRNFSASGIVQALMKRPLVGIGLVVVAAAAGLLLLNSSRPPSDSGYRVNIQPSRPLSVSECLSELRRLGSGFHSEVCRAGRGRPWFRLRLRNVSDNLGSPACRATAYDSHGDALFEDDLPLGIVNFPGGPPVPKGTTFRLTWYLSPTYAPKPWTPAMIDHYTASCHGRTDSQIPI